MLINFGTLLVFFHSFSLSLFFFQTNYFFGQIRKVDNGLLSLQIHRTSLIIFTDVFSCANAIQQSKEQIRKFSYTNIVKCIYRVIYIHYEL